MCYKLYHRCVCVGGDLNTILIKERKNTNDANTHLFNLIFYCEFQPVKVLSAGGVSVLTRLSVPIQYGLDFLRVSTQVQKAHHKVFTLCGEICVIVLQHTLKNTFM